MTAPLVPPEVDLTDFSWMPLEIARLKRSKSWLLAKKNPELAFYMINLWTAAWHERPAGSLEDDEDVLIDVAMCKPARWKAVRAQVMRGWVKGEDGRLYHPVVAEKVLESWKAKIAQRSKTAAATAARALKHSNDTSTSRERDDRQKDQRHEERDDNVTSTSRSPRDLEVKRSGTEGIENRDVGVTPTDTALAAPPKVNGAVEKIAKSRAKGNGDGQDWDDPTYVYGSAKTFDMEQRPNEPYPDFRDRIYAEAQRRIVSAASVVGRRVGHA